MTQTNVQTREALLNVAERLFSERGYSAVGTREIAEQAGANLASIRYYFGSKHDLYMATVQRAMTRPNGENPWDLLALIPDEPEAAARRLHEFTHRFLCALLPTSGVDPCGTLIIREALQPSEAIDSVVRDYIQPNEQMLTRLARVFKPDLTDRELSWFAQGILGQIVHYRVFRPIIERLRGETLGEPEQLEALSRHITAFSLRGLGCDEAFVQRVLGEPDQKNDAIATKESTL